jgi:hypothetical protein
MHNSPVMIAMFGDRISNKPELDALPSFVREGDTVNDYLFAFDLAFNIAYCRIFANLKIQAASVALE